MGAGHDHGHAADTKVSRMVLAAGVLTVFFAVELTTALAIGSIALLADAGHMLTDLVAMFMGLTAVLLARRGSTSPARTYGWLSAGVVTVTTGWPYADVVVAVFVALWVLPRAVSLARAALRILSETSPSHIDVDELRRALCGVTGVTEVHDLHVWTLVPGKDMVTAHLTSSGDAARVLDDARAVLAARGLAHATVQIEPPDAAADCECETTT